MLYDFMKNYTISYMLHAKYIKINTNIYKMYTRIQNTRRWGRSAGRAPHDRAGRPALPPGILYTCCSPLYIFYYILYMELYKNV